MSRFIIPCGGTGGHLSPGIALAEGLIERGHDCTLIISNKQVDSRLIQAYPDLEFIQLPGVGLSMNPLGLMRFGVQQIKAVYASLKLLREKKPDMILGFGGFTSVGIALAGFLLGIPLVFHEANRCTGKAIRFLSVLAKRVYLPPGVQLRSLPPKTIRHLGYPVRKEIRPMSKDVACKKLGIGSDRKRVLVLGGSQGANKLNQWLLDNFERLGALGVDAYCVTGLGKCADGKLEYITESGNVAQAIFTPFADNMAEIMCASDLVVSRAGAGSIAEFSRCCLPSILIPFPHSADNHQVENARFHERQGGGIVVKEDDMDTLFDEVSNLVFNDWLLDKFRQNLKRLEAENSLQLITRDLEVLCAQNESVVVEGRG